MKRLAVVSVAVVFCAALTLRAGSASVPPPPPVDVATVTASAAAPTLSPNDTIKEFCTGCHNQYDLKGELDLENFDVAKAADHAATGEKMIRKLRAGLMPPKSEPQPDRDTRMALVTALETTLDKAAAKPMPGRRTFQRLNRAEYAAAVRSIFGIDVDVAAYLPSDTISASFDNIADVQMPSATVMQGYMRAAAYVASAVVGDPAADASSTTYEVPRTQSQKDRVEGAPFGTRGGIVVTHNFLADGDYKFQLLLHGEPTGLLFGRTIGNKIQMEVAIDDERAQLIKVDRWITESDPAAGTRAHRRTDSREGRTAPHRRDVRARVRGRGRRSHQADRSHARRHADRRRLRRDDAAAPAQPRDRGTVQGDGRVRQPGAAEGVLVPSREAGRRRAVREADLPAPGDRSVSPARDGGGRRRADAVLRAGRASRATSTPASAPACRRCCRACTSFSASRRCRPASRAGAVYRISRRRPRVALVVLPVGHDSRRRSCSTRRAAATLQKPDVIEKQVRRMLADPRSDALGSRFAAQWLRLQDLQKIEPDALLFPYYDETLAESMDKETRLFFDYLVRADRPALELLTADYTFVNERLARHYGISGVTGPDFVKVTYPDDHRRGILGHGSILTLTSHGNRTSPVLRGKWVLEVLLGTPPPPPPPERAGSREDRRRGERPHAVGRRAAGACIARARSAARATT